MSAQLPPPAWLVSPTRPLGSWPHYRRYGLVHKATRIMGGRPSATSITICPVRPATHGVLIHHFMGCKATRNARVRVRMTRYGCASRQVFARSLTRSLIVAFVSFQARTHFHRAVSGGARAAIASVSSRRALRRLPARPPVHAAPASAPLRHRLGGLAGRIRPARASAPPAALRLTPPRPGPISPRRRRGTASARFPRVPVSASGVGASSSRALSAERALCPWSPHPSPPCGILHNAGLRCAMCLPLVVTFLDLRSPAFLRHGSSSFFFGLPRPQPRTRRSVAPGVQRGAGLCQEATDLAVGSASDDVPKTTMSPASSSPAAAHPAALATRFSAGSPNLPRAATPASGGESAPRCTAVAFAALIGTGTAVGSRSNGAGVAPHPGPAAPAARVVCRHHTSATRKLRHKAQSTWRVVGRIPRPAAVTTAAAGPPRHTRKCFPAFPKAAQLHMASRSRGQPPPTRRTHRRDRSRYTPT